MKKAVFFIALAVCVVLTFASFLPSSKAENAALAKTTEPALSQNALEARFLNMLNHNFVYNEAFESADQMVNDSMPALLSLKDGEDSDYIAEGYVAAYIYDMYGLEIVDMSALNADFPQKQGYLYIIPRGYTVYSHTNPDCVKNEDGSYTVTTEVQIKNHDNDVQSLRASTLFVENQNSSFGYNIVYSNIYTEVYDI